jgi:hypothetical protein
VETAPEPAEQNREARLGAWWATRLGIAFLVIAVVFFGVYISTNARPWVRLVEVGIVAGLVTGLGRWLERKAPVYGQVIFAGGLSLFYFTAYAAYAVKPMQVVATLPTGLALQFGAVAGLTAVAWRRNRSSIAAMSLFLGTLTCLFALSYHFQVTLFAAFGLLAVGAALRVARGWTWPLGFAYMGAQACFVGAVLTAIGYNLDPAMVVEGALQSHPFHGLGLTANSPAFTLLFPAGIFLVLLAADCWAQSRDKIGARVAREWSVRVAAVAYGLTGWWGGGAVGGETWAANNLLAAAGACAIAGAIYWKRRDLPALVEMFFTAAASWFAVYLLLEYVGWVRWAALLAEAFILASWMRRRPAVLPSLGMLGAWLLSGIMAGWSAIQITNSTPDWDVQRLVFALWALASTGLWRWLESAKREPLAWELGLRNFGGVVTAIGAIALGEFAWTYATQTWLFLGLAAVTAALGLALGGREIWKTAGTTLVASWFTLLAHIPNPEWYHWALLLAEAFVLAGWLRRREQPWVAAFFGGAWMMSLFVAGECAYQLPLASGMEPWAWARLEFLFWPLSSMGLWAWLEHSPRSTSTIFRQNLQAGAVGTALGAVALGVMAWTGLAETWLFVGLALAAFALGQMTRTKAAYYTAGASLLAALWTFQPAINATPGEIIGPLLLLTAAVAAGTWGWQRHATEETRSWATAAEITYFLSLLKTWITGLHYGDFPATMAPVVLTLLALVLGCLAWRGPWKVTGDLAWFWALAGWVEWEVYVASNNASRGVAWLCLGVMVTLSWLWGVLARREKPAVTMLRLDSMGLFLPALLLAGWVHAVPHSGWSQSTHTIITILVASAFAQIARREWLPSGAATATLVGAYAWWLAATLKPGTVDDCVAPFVVLVAVLQMGWLLRRRLAAGNLTGQEMLRPLLVVLALAALAAFDIPAYQLSGDVRQKFLTFLWAVAGGAVFIGGLAGRIKQYRYVGLAGLLLCLPRLFFVDITNALGRIFAFGARAVVLLAIGFSYDRLRTWLDDDGLPSPPPKNHS